MTVYTDGEAAYEVERLQHEILVAEDAAHRLSAAGHGGIVDADGFEEAEAKVAELKAEQEKAVAKALHDGKHTFHLRGVPDKVLRVIEKKALNVYPPVSRGTFPEGQDGDDAFERESLIRNRDRAALMTRMEVAHSIIKVEDSEGRVDTRVWSADDVEVIQDNLYQTEWAKIVLTQRKLTNGQNIFAATIERDADFLSKR